MISFSNDKNICLKDYRLLIPSTCVGNVSQLTCDLIIENFQMPKIGEVFHPSIVPLVGASAFSHIKDSFTTAAEIYVDESKKIAILQLRTPLAAPLMGDFFKKLSDFAKTQQVKEVIILTASYGYEKHLVTGCDYGYKSNKDHDLTAIGVPQTTTPKILGGGYAVKLLEALTTANVTGLILFKYVSEGDNIPDAVTLLLKLNELIKIIEEDSGGKPRLEMPVSWKYLFGNRPPMEIY